MANDLLTPAELAALRAWDTPSICNALELVASQRRGFGYTTQPLVAAQPALPPIVGYARTATVRAMHPSTRSAAEVREQRLAYYRSISEGPQPSVVPAVSPTVVPENEPPVGPRWRMVACAHASFVAWHESSA